jgi:hypothetical protein
MLKNILRELCDVLNHLDKTGYFDDRRKETTTFVDVIVKDIEKQKARVTKSHEMPISAIGKKLTPKDALDIYNEDRMSYEDIAAIYDVSPVTISQIKSGGTWWKVTGHKRNIYNRKSK